LTRIELSADVIDDFDRILEHLRQHESADGSGRIEGIVQAIDVLHDNPNIGRPVGDGLRELVIGRDTRGYVALYRYLVEWDLVTVLAVRSQREAGYVRSL
jgi:toxin ParE1/3/4